MLRLRGFALHRASIADQLRLVDWTTSMQTSECSVEEISCGQLMPAQFAPQGQPTCESMPDRCGLRDNACHAKEGEPDFGGEWRDDMDWDNFCPSGEYRQGMAVSRTASGFVHGILGAQR